ncbi:hypothetical protein VTO42DRAFT_3191 [Malbranchea cinnamomea]
MVWIPFPLFCFQCGTDTPCRCKVVGPTLGFYLGIVTAIVCYPASLFCGCCATKTGSRVLGFPVDVNNAVSRAIPF